MTLLLVALLVLACLQATPIRSDAGSSNKEIALLKDPKAETRERAARVLGRSGDIQAVDALLGVLGDPSPKVKGAAIQALRAIQRHHNSEPEVSSVIDHALAIALADRRTFPKEAVLALGRVRDTRAARVLIPLLKRKEGFPSPAFYAKESLISLGTVAVEPLIGALNDSDVEIRRDVVQALGEIFQLLPPDRFAGLSEARARVSEALIGLMKQDHDAALRRSAVQALAQVKASRTAEFLVDFLRALNNLPEAGLVQSVSNALEEIGKPEWEALLKTQDLRSTGGRTRAAETFMAALRDTNPYIRERAAEALGELRNARAVESLTGALRDEDPLVRTEAARALGSIRDPRAIEPLIETLAAPMPSPGTALLGRDRYVDLGDRVARADKDFRRAAMLALKQLDPLLAALKDEEVGAQLRRRVEHDGDILRLKDPDANLRRHAANSLSSRAHSGGLAREEGLAARAAEALIVNLGDPYEDVRAAAADALGEIGNERAVEPLVGVLNDQSELVRLWAAEALRKRGDSRALEPLIAILRGTKAWQPFPSAHEARRSSAATALGEMGDVRALEPLIAALKDEVASVRQAAAAALGEIDEPRAARALAAYRKQEQQHEQQEREKERRLRKGLGDVCSSCEDDSDCRKGLDCQLFELRERPSGPSGGRTRRCAYPGAATVVCPPGSN